MNGTPRLLVVDDDPADRHLIARAVRDLGASVELLEAESSEAALAVIEGDAAHRKLLVVLDLNLVAGDGRDLLRSLATSGALPLLAVVVFTNSSRREDVVECFQLGAKSFLRKPSSFPDLTATISMLIRYWLELSELP